jgi:hypothetical protein
MIDRFPRERSGFSLGRNFEKKEEKKYLDGRLSNFVKFTYIPVKKRKKLRSFIIIFSLG